MTKRLRIDLELTEAQAKEFEILIEEDYDEAMDKAEFLMLDSPMIVEIDIVEIH